MTTDHWGQEQQVAIAAVRCAARVCRAVAQRLVTPETLEKKDRSPVTVADFASQAVVCSHLAQHFKQDTIIAEEDARELRGDGQETIREVVAQQVSAGLGRAVDGGQALDWIDLGGAGRGGVDPSPSRFWTLDPIDGTKGFLRGGQYAVALGLIEQGRVVLGVLGCPNLPFGGDTGVLMIAVHGGGTRVMSLWDSGEASQPVHVDGLVDPCRARFCESVESGHSNHGASVAIAKQLGIEADPVRMDSQAKYATVARGDASIYMRLPTRADYVEKIWDHAAGSIVVTEAGGRVTDVSGSELDFSRGKTLSANKGIIATNGTIHDAVIEAVASVVS